MKAREFWLLFTPSLIVMGGLLVLPLFRTVQWSFVGLDNFADALTDPRFHRAVFFTVTVTVVTVALLLVIGYVIATLVNQLGRARPLVLGILLVSYVLPTLVGAVAYSWLFDDNFGGVVNHIISFFGGQQVLWFTDRVPNAILIISNTVWHMLPFAMLIILAGLQGVPNELLEAAKIDGASAWFTFRRLTLPMIKPVLLIVAMLRMVEAFRVYDILYGTTRGGPGTSTETINWLIFREGFQYFDLGRATAMSVLVLLIVLVLTNLLFQQLIKAIRAN
jgi:ABC-type sugar transport system permease subunit